MIYEKHLIKNLLAHLLITMGAIIVLIWLSQVMKLAFVVELGSGAQSFLFLTISALPTIALTILPIATSIAYFGGFSFLNSDRELIALCSSGLSNLQIAKPAIRLASIICILCYFFSFYLAPKSYHYLKSSLNNFRNNFVANVIHEKSFNQLSKNVTLYVDSKNINGEMKEVIIFDNRNKKESSIIFAKSGALHLENNIPSFMLYDGMRQVIDKKGNMSQMTFDNFKIALPQGNTERSIASRSLQEYTIWQLLFPDPSIPVSRIGEMRQEMHQRILWPGFCISFALITLGFFLKNPHKRTDDYKSAIRSIIIIVVFLYIHFSIYNISSSYPLLIILCYLNLLLSGVVGYRLLKS